MKTVATRFAPSPTGPLHIGGVRTALFNWLYSKNKGGKFYLRIEDTDKERSKDEFKNQIINSLKWIGIYYEDNEYIQSDKINDHINVANELLKKGLAYKCYCSSEEIEEQKKRAKQKKIPYIYNRKWRDKSETDAPKEVKPVIRFKSKVEGKSILKDLVQGNVEGSNIQVGGTVIGDVKSEGQVTLRKNCVLDNKYISPRFDMGHGGFNDQAIALYYGTISGTIINKDKQTITIEWLVNMPWKWPNYDEIGRTNGRDKKETYPLPNLLSFFDLGPRLLIDNELGGKLEDWGLAKRFDVVTKWITKSNCKK